MVGDDDDRIRWFLISTLEGKNVLFILQIAIRCATEDLLEYVTILLEAGASINFQKSTPLLDLIRRYNGDPNITNICLNVARKLIEAGCDVNQLTTISTLELNGVGIAKTPLIQAIERNFLEFASLLLDYGADPNIKCKLFQSCTLRMKQIYLTDRITLILYDKTAKQGHFDWVM